MSHRNKLTEHDQTVLAGTLHHCRAAEAGEARVVELRLSVRALMERYDNCLQMDHIANPPMRRVVTTELWSDDETVRVPKANYTVSIAAAAASLWSRFIDDWKRTQAHCAAQTDPCRPSIANEE